MHRHPIVGRADADFLTDFIGIQTDQLAQYESLGHIRRKLALVPFIGVPELPLIQCRLGIGPGTGTRTPASPIVEPVSLLLSLPATTFAAEPDWSPCAEFLEWYVSQRTISGARFSAVNYAGFKSDPAFRRAVGRSPTSRPRSSKPAMRSWHFTSTLTTFLRSRPSSITGRSGA